MVEANLKLRSVKVEPQATSKEENHRVVRINNLLKIARIKFRLLQKHPDQLKFVSKRGFHKVDATKIVTPGTIPRNTLRTSM